MQHLTFSRTILLRTVFTTCINLEYYATTEGLRGIGGDAHLLPSRNKWQGSGVDTEVSHNGVYDAINKVQRAIGRYRTNPRLSQLRDQSE